MQDSRYLSRTLSIKVGRLNKWVKANCKHKSNPSNVVFNNKCVQFGAFGTMTRVRIASLLLQGLQGATNSRIVGKEDIEALGIERPVADELCNEDGFVTLESVQILIQTCSLNRLKGLSRCIIIKTTFSTKLIVINQESPRYNKKENQNHPFVHFFEKNNIRIEDDQIYWTSKNFDDKEVFKYNESAKLIEFSGNINEPAVPAMSAGSDESEGSERSVVQEEQKESEESRTHRDDLGTVSWFTYFVQKFWRS